MAAEGTFDGVLLGIAQQHAGIDALLDTMFSFLRRKTDFFTGAASGKARDAVLSAFDRQRRLADEQKSGSGDNEKAAAEASRQIAARKAAAAALTPEELLAKEAADLEKKAVPKVAAETATSISATTSATTTTAAASGDEKKSDAMATDDDDKPDDPAKGAQPNIGNGSTGPGYVWTQVLSDVEVRVPLKAGDWQCVRSVCTANVTVCRVEKQRFGCCHQEESPASWCEGSASSARWCIRARS
jgi:hypothetical protein